MKTPAQVLNDHTPPGEGYHSSWVILAMKEYAKQWIERAAKVGREYPYGEAITESIMDIKDEIDAQ